MRRIGQSELREMLETAACDVDEASWSLEKHTGGERFGLSQGGYARLTRDVQTRNGIMGKKGDRVRLVSGLSGLGDVNVQFNDGRRGTLRTDDLSGER